MSRRLRHILGIARSTGRDLGMRCGSGLALLAGLMMVALLRPVQAEDAAVAAKLRLYQQVVLLQWFAVFAAIFAAAWSVAEDRRSGRLAQWLTTPLRPWEYVVGKFLGVTVGAGSVAAIIMTILLAWPGTGIFAQREVFGPRQWIAPSRVESASGQTVSWSAFVLRHRQKLRLLYSELPESATMQLAVTVREIGEETPTETNQPPVLRCLDATGAEVAVFEEIQLPMRDVRFSLPKVAALPLVVELDVGEWPRGALLIEPANIALVSEAGSPWVAWGRALLGLGSVVAIGVAFATMAATFLADVIALLVAGSCIAIGLIRGLLLDVTTAVAEATEHYRQAVVWLSAAAAKLLRWVPDLPTLAGGRALVEAREPFSWSDPFPWMSLGFWVAGLLLLGTCALHGFRRWFPSTES